MLNLTADSIIFNVTGSVLSSKVRRAFELAMEKHLVAVGLDRICVEDVTTKTNIRAAFAKFVKGRILRDPDRQFDAAYVNTLLEAYKAKTGHLTKKLFDTVMAADASGPYSYKTSYASTLKPGLGLFLVALHSSGSITLPATFHWPSVRDTNRRRLEIGKLVASELLAFVRTLNSQTTSLPHPAFEAIGGDSARRAWFLTYATKLLLATGWHSPEDANLVDLIKISAAQIEGGGAGKNSIPFAYSALLDVLNLAFPGRINITSKDWMRTVQTERSSISNEWLQWSMDGPSADNDLLREVLNFRAAWGHPDRIRSLSQLPGLNVDIREMSRVWLDVEYLFVSKVARESYRPYYAAVGWWNVYLFHYLPYWFDRNPKSPWAFPSSPSRLIKTVFVSRLLPLEGKHPVTFIDFMNAQAERRRWNGSNFYAILGQLQSFFTFIEHYSQDIPECEGFTQPLAPHDFPRTSRTKNTGKVPIPRRLFGVLIDYYEALIAHLEAVLEGVVSGKISQVDLKRLNVNGNIVDTFATSHLVGFVPVLITPARTIALQFIPNVLDLRRRKVKGGLELFLPSPHALHQNLVALHTGLRHNHIQWLDRDRFDTLVRDDDFEFSTLFVNTDKEKTKPWCPCVRFRVVEVLRAQRRWCELIEDSAFQKEHFYNDNPRTKWPKFRPLFAYKYNGAPHDDDVYTGTWGSVLCGLQGLLPELSDFAPSRTLLRLLPPGFRPDDVELEQALSDYGATFKKMGESCPLRVYTASTAHSSRVAVVSQYITFLPTDLIGKYITGQKAGTVAYYVHLDPKDLEVQQVQQGARMRDAALRAAFEPVWKGAGASSSFVHADDVNSSLARSMKVNVEDAIKAHGGMCITFSERTKHGLDLLREVGAANVAFNKTEICPYGNECPPDVVKELGGLRRCSLCPYAVRFVDHLPAVMVKKHQVADAVDALEKVLSSDAQMLNTKFTPTELDLLEADRARLCEDLTGWILSEEVLEVMRQRIASGQDARNWTVQRPELVAHDLKRVSVQTSESEYLLARLGECIAFPSLESPQVQARFDLLRRELLARAGHIREAFSTFAVDPAAECAGMLKAIVESRGFTLSEMAAVLDNENYITSLPGTELRLLSGDGSI